MTTPMTVSQLIKALADYNPDATVDVYTPGYHGMGVTFNYAGVSGPAHAATIHGTTAGIVYDTHYEAALNELGLEDVPHETRHVEAATVHALLAIADQLRIANLLTLAHQDPDETYGADHNTTPQEALEALYNTHETEAPYSYDNPSDTYTVAELTPDVANLLGIHRHEEDQA